MKLRLLIAFILVFLIGNSGCKVADGASDNAFQYTVTVLVRENEVPMPVIMDVFMRSGVLVINMKQFFLASYQVEYTVTCRSMGTRQMNELRDELLQQPGILSIDVKRIL